MRRFARPSGWFALVFAGLVGGAAGADPKPNGPAPNDGRSAPAAVSSAVENRARPADESIDQILERGAPPSSDQPPATALPARQPPHAPDAAVGVDKAPAKAPSVKPMAKGAEQPAAPVTDDNDTTGEAVRPTALKAVQPIARPRLPGPYELGELDCRMLDGAGIERLLPKKIVAGEEPDLLCRVLVTQPATVAATTHALTLTVLVGSKPTYQQQRSVRISSVGRRSIVFIVPADRISSEDAAAVTLRAVLSAPAKPPNREVKFVVEPAD